MFFYSALKVKLGCRGQRVAQLTRRELKLQSRQVDLIFGFIFSALTGVIAYGFIKDFLRDECQDDKRYQRMLKVSQVIMFLVGASGLYLLVVSIVTCHKKCKTMRKMRRDPPEVSSDEEDDKEFIENLEAQRAEQDLENGGEPGAGRRDLANNLDVRDLLMNQIRDIIDTTSRRR